MPSFYVTSKFYIKEIKGKYYVYSMEKDEGGKQRHYYVAPLERIIETYVNIGSGEEPPQCRGRDLNPGHRLERAVLFSKKGFRNALRFPLYLFKLMEKSRDEKYDF